MYVCVCVWLAMGMFLFLFSKIPCDEAKANAFECCESCSMSCMHLRVYRERRTRVANNCERTRCEDAINALL
jgi:hypothetical protein